MNEKKDFVSVKEKSVEVRSEVAHPVELVTSEMNVVVSQQRAGGIIFTVVARHAGEYRDPQYRRTQI